MGEIEGEKLINYVYTIKYKNKGDIMKHKNIMIAFAVMLMLTIGTASAIISEGISSDESTNGLNEVIFGAVSKTKTSITWSWTTPEADETYGNVVNNYVKVVERATGIEVASGTIMTTNNKTELFTASNLKPATAYTITVKTEYLITETINLCTKAVNEGNPWGYCDEAATKGQFEYTPEGATLWLRAKASGLALPSGTEYKLIYYKDTDEAHKLPSTLAVNVLATSTSNGDKVGFVGNVDMGADIPSEDDINPRGKIWIVPASEINEDGTLKWTGYAQGATMADYLFEEDSDTSLTPPDSMGGITYTYTVS